VESDTSNCDSMSAGLLLGVIQIDVLCELFGLDG
jgi:hypothetical protein